MTDRLPLENNRQIQQSRRWCFTVNNYTEQEELAWRNEHPLKRLSEWGIVGFEKAPTTGTRHLQGYIFLHRKMRLNGIKSQMGNGGTHLEVARGDHRSNRDYCKKNGDFIEWGTFPTDPGEIGATRERLRWDAIRDAAIAGDWEQIPPQIYIAHYRTLKQLHADKKEIPNPLPDVCGLWLYGRSGCGKSTEARARADALFLTSGIGGRGGRSFYAKDAAHKWWDSYANEPTIIIDDVDSSHGHLRYYLKIWADKWAFEAERKSSGTGWIRPTLVIVTSQHRIGEIFGGDPTVTNAIARRFKQEQLEHWQTRTSGALLGQGEVRGSELGRMGDGLGLERHPGGDVGQTGWDQTNDGPSDLQEDLRGLEDLLDWRVWEGYGDT